MSEQNDDLVEKLRDHEDRMARRGDHRAASYYAEAADEVVRLREENTQLLGVLKSMIATYGEPHRGEWLSDEAFKAAQVVYNKAVAAIAKATGEKMNNDDVWEPTCILRRFGVGDVLQQRWRKPVLNHVRQLIGWDYEWRSVPHVYLYSEGTAIEGNPA